MSGRWKRVIGLLAVAMFPLVASAAEAGPRVVAVPANRPATRPAATRAFAARPAATQAATQGATTRRAFAVRPIISFGPTTVPATRPSFPPIPGYASIETAIPSRLLPTTLTAPGRVGYLGVEAEHDAAGKLMITHVDPLSPASAAGLRDKDELRKAGSESFARPEAFQQWLLSRQPGETVSFTVIRDGKEVLVSAVLTAASRPMKQPGQRAVMGVLLRDATQSDGAVVDRVTQGGPADQSGMRDGDVIIELDGVPVPSRQSFTDNLAARNPGDDIKLMVKRAGKVEELHVKLVAEKVATQLLQAIERFPGPFRKPAYRLALIGVEYPDVKHNSEITADDWEQSFFSRGTYNKTSATGQPVFGSINDYYIEVSAGMFHVEGKMFDWIEADKKRAEYGQGTGDNAKLLPEILDKLLVREGKDALAGYDGVAFIYAGERFATTRGGLYWPHKGFVPHAGKRWTYVIVNEGGKKMTNISVFTHEFGHMLGLPDLYARPETPGSEGLGVWCLMSNQISTGRPQHMSAWCKEQLGWVKPVVIDPTVKQRLVLASIEDAPNDCIKVVVKPDGSEYLLLENRRKTGWDRELPGEGLLVWRVINGKPMLEASHGIDGPAGPRSFLSEVPFPSKSNHAFTPYTIPSSRSLVGGGLPVYITEIERRADGRISFAIGYKVF